MDISFPANYIRVCNRNLSPEYLNECVRRSILMLKPRLSRGIPQLSLPPFNPLHLPKVSFSQDQGPINLNSTYTNIKIYGLSDFKLQSVKIDLKKNYFQLQMMFPELYMTADYLISGHILMLPLQGQGLSYGNYSKFVCCKKKFIMNHSGFFVLIKSSPISYKK